MECCRSMNFLPDSISKLALLTSLSMVECRGVELLPGGLSCLTRLRILNLNRNLRLRALPPNLGELEELQVLASNLAFDPLSCKPCALAVFEEGFLVIKLV